MNEAVDEESQEKRVNLTTLVANGPSEIRRTESHKTQDSYKYLDSQINLIHYLESQKSTTNSHRLANGQNFVTIEWSLIGKYMYITLLAEILYSI